VGEPPWPPWRPRYRLRICRGVHLKHRRLPTRTAACRCRPGFSINLPVPARSDEDAWGSLLEHIAVPAALEFRPDLVLISAGYDAHRDDAQGGCELEAGSFAEMARHLRALGEEVAAPVGVVLEGGYALDALATSVAATLEALTGDEPPEMVAPDFLTTRAVLAHRALLGALNAPRTRVGVLELPAHARRPRRAGCSWRSRRSRVWGRLWGCADDGRSRPVGISATTRLRAEHRREHAEGRPTDSIVPATVESPL
jgi:Histone deacetylase domain